MSEESDRDRICIAHTQHVRGAGKQGPDLAKPTPLLCPLESLRIRVEMTWPKCFNMFSSSCSSIDSGRLEMYKFVGSCSCCCTVGEKKKKITEADGHNEDTLHMKCPNYR